MGTQTTVTAVGHVNYKQVHTRWHYEYGRYVVETLVGSLWSVVAIVENQSVAKKLAADLQALLVASRDEDNRVLTGES